MFHDESFDISKLQIGQELWVREYAVVEYNRNVSAYGWRAKHYDGGLDINRLGSWKKLPVLEIHIGKKEHRKYIPKKYIGKPYAFSIGNQFLSMTQHASDGAFEFSNGCFIQVSTVEPPDAESEEKQDIAECNELTNSLKSSIENFFSQ